MCGLFGMTSKFVECTPGQNTVVLKKMAGQVDRWPTYCGPKNWYPLGVILASCSLACVSWARLAVETCSSPIKPANKC